MPFCNQCGADVAGLRFCSKCGAAVEAGAAAPRPSAAPAGAPPAAQGSGEISENVAAALAYIWPVAVVWLLIEPYKNKREVRFHSFQSLFYALAMFVIWWGLWILTLVLSFAGAGFIIGLPSVLFGPAAFVLWIILVIKAYQGQHFKVPVIGDFAEKQAG